MKTVALASLLSLATVAASVGACSDDGAVTPTIADAGGGPDGSVSTSGGGADDAAADAPSTAGGLTTGEGYSIVYSGALVIGTDARPTVSATFDRQGHMTAYKASDDESLALGAATDPSAGGDALSAWGAWQGGPTTGKWYNAQPAGDFTFPTPDGGFHYAIGKETPVASLPTGSVSYTLVGGSKPTREGATAAGTLTSASATCDFGMKKCSFTITATMAEGAATIAAEEGSINSRQVRTTSVVAMLVGGAGERIALVYGIDQGGKVVRGAASLEK